MQLYHVLYVSPDPEKDNFLWRYGVEPGNKKPIKILIHTGEQYKSTQEFIRHATDPKHAEKYANNIWELKSERGGSEELYFEFERRLKVKDPKVRQLDLLKNTKESEKKTTIELDTEKEQEPVTA